MKVYSRTYDLSMKGYVRTLWSSKRVIVVGTVATCEYQQTAGRWRFKSRSCGLWCPVVRGHLCVTTHDTSNWTSRQSIKLGSLLAECNSSSESRMNVTNVLVPILWVTLSTSLYTGSKMYSYTGCFRTIFFTKGSVMWRRSPSFSQHMLGNVHTL